MLKLAHNKITDLPDEINNLKKIKYIKISFNNLLKINITNKSLTELYLGNDNFSKIPKEIYSLTK